MIVKLEVADICFKTQDDAEPPFDDCLKVHKGKMFEVHRFHATRIATCAQRLARWTAFTPFMQMRALQLAELKQGLYL